MVTINVTLLSGCSRDGLAAVLTDDFDDVDRDEVEQYGVDRLSRLQSMLKPVGVFSWDWEKMARDVRRSQDEKWTLRENEDGRGRTLGFIVMKPIPSLSNQVQQALYLKMIAVHPECRGLRFGPLSIRGRIRGSVPTLLTLAGRRAKEINGTGRIALHAWPAAKALCRLHGWERIEGGDENERPYFEGFVA